MASPCSHPVLLHPLQVAIVRAPTSSAPQSGNDATVDRATVGFSRSPSYEYRQVPVALLKAPVALYQYEVLEYSTRLQRAVGGTEPRASSPHRGALQRTDGRLLTRGERPPPSACCCSSSELHRHGLSTSRPLVVDLGVEASSRRALRSFVADVDCGGSGTRAASARVGALRQRASLRWLATPPAPSTDHDAPCTALL